MTAQNVIAGLTLLYESRTPFYALTVWQKRAEHRPAARQFCGPPHELVTSNSEVQRLKDVSVSYKLFNFKLNLISKLTKLRGAGTRHLPWALSFTCLLLAHPASVDLAWVTSQASLGASEGCWTSY